MVKSGYFKIALLSLLTACASEPRGLKPVELADKVDLPRFMGDWYVIAAIPTIFEKNSYNAKDSYRLEADGTIATTFSFNAGSFDGPAKTYESRGFVLDRSTNAVWGQQYVWPVKADYRISYVSADYTKTVVTREKRDYVWIMARTPTIPDAELARLVEFVGRQGYDVARLQRAPQAGGTRSMP
jgi:apolipoprotein D and lipocalin family protein